MNSTSTELVYLYRTERLDEALEMILEEEMPKVIRFIKSKLLHSYGRAPAEIGDLYGRIYASVIAAVNSYDYRSRAACSLFSWIITHALNECRNVLRRLTTVRMSHENSMMSLDALPFAVQEMVAVEEEGETASSYENQLDALMPHLSPFQISVLQQRMGGRHNNEIAADLNIKAKTVANAYEKIKQAARRHVI